MFKKYKNEILLSLVLVILFGISVLSLISFENRYLDNSREDLTEKIGEGIVYAYFWREDCIWCQKADPIINEIEQTNNINIVTIDVTTTIGRQFFDKHGISGTPTIVRFIDGVENGRLVGYSSYFEDFLLNSEVK